MDFIFQQAGQLKSAQLSSTPRSPAASTTIPAPSSR